MSVPSGCAHEGRPGHPLLCPFQVNLWTLHCKRPVRRDSFIGDNTINFTKGGQIASGGCGAVHIGLNNDTGALLLLLLLLLLPDVSDCSAPLQVRGTNF